MASGMTVIAVAAINIWMFSGIEAMDQAAKAEIYARIYLTALIIPILSVSGVVLAGLMRRFGAKYVDSITEAGPQAAKGTTYREYVEAMEILLEIPGMDQYVGPGMSSEEDWQPWPPEIDAYVDPMDIIEDTTIPILAVFGELDKSVDPLQGAAAYEEALQKAGNPHSHVELIPGVGHTLQKQSTGCAGDPPGGYADRYTELIDEWLEMLAG